MNMKVVSTSEDGLLPSNAEEDEEANVLVD